MGKLNTGFNAASAYYNRRTAHAAEAANIATRRAELRARGLVGHDSTDAEVAKVEHRLALQMRARDALAETGKPRNPQGKLVAVAFALALLAAVIARRGGVEGGGAFVTFVVAAVAVLAVGVPIVRRREWRRAALVSRADWTSRGVCGWCHSSDEHLVDGKAEHPLVAHAVEVDAAIRER